MKNWRRGNKAEAWVAILIAASELLAQLPKHTALLVPNRWPTEDLERYQRLDTQFWNGQPEATGSRGMVAGTSGPLAVHAGLEVLKSGGNAADAALCTAFTQIALMAGFNVSYAGMMTVVYYDARSAKVYTLNAGYNTYEMRLNP